MAKNRIYSGLSIVTIGQVCTYGLSFLRNLFLARLLSKYDFGLSVTFILAIEMMDFTYRMSFGRQIVQSVDGDKKIFISTAHTFQMIVAIISSLIMIVMSLPISYIFEVKDKYWAFAILSIIPILRGLTHLDHQKRQRNYNFLPTVLSEFIPQLIVTAIIWPLYLLVSDYRLALILIILKALLSLLITHIVAKIPYKWGWEKSISTRMWKFSWPLILNGLLIYASQQGDQMIVGGGYSLEILAIYSAGATLIAAPFMIIAQTANSIMLPLLAKEQKNINSFIRKYRVCLNLSCVIAVLSMTPLIIGSEQLLKFLYGSKYIGGGTIMSILGAVCALRFLRIAPANAAMAKSDTQNQMISNFYRVSSLVFAGFCIYSKLPVEFIAICGVIGEVLALSVSTYRLKQRQGIPIYIMIKPFSYLAGNILLALSTLLFGLKSCTLLEISMIIATWIICSIVTSIIFFPRIFENLGINTKKIGTSKV